VEKRELFSGLALGTNFPLLKASSNSNRLFYTNLRSNPLCIRKYSVSTVFNQKVRSKKYIPAMQHKNIANSQNKISFVVKCKSYAQTNKYCLLFIKIFSPVNIVKAFTIFITGFLLRVFIVSYFNVNVFVDYLSFISISFYAFMAFFSVFISDLFSSIEFNFPKVDFNLFIPSYIKQKLNGIWDGVNHNKLTVTGKPASQDHKPTTNVDKAKPPISKMDRVGEGSGGLVNPAFTHIRAWTNLFQYNTSTIDRQVVIRQLNCLVNPDRSIRVCLDLYYEELQSKLTLLIIQKIVDEQADGFATRLDVERLRKLLESRDRARLLDNLTPFLQRGGVYSSDIDLIRDKVAKLEVFKSDYKKIISRPSVLNKVLSGEFVPGTNSNTGDMEYNRSDP
jgi:hypothetical protein